MTSSPYVPSSGGQNQDPQTGEWATGTPESEQSTTGSTSYGQFDEPVTSWEPAGTTAAGTDIYAPSTSTSTSGGAGSAKDAAKDEAAELKDTAVDKGQQVAGVAKEQAGAVKDTAVESGQHVAAVAKDEVSRVTAEASTQVRDLLSQGRDELSSQAGAQQQRLGSLVHSFADELGSMASASDKSGPLTDLAHEGSRRIGALAHRLEGGSPTDLLDDLRRFARRRPVAFLTASALAGVVVGRLTRSLAAEAKDAKQAEQTPALGTSSYSTTPSPGYDAGTYSAGGYETGSYTAGTSTTTGYEPARVYDEPTAGYDDTVTYVEPGQGDTPR